jgi:TP901 family phage tail tape measure protein
LLNVSEFTDADKASEALISTIQAYGYAAKDAMSVVDVLNEIGNNFAVSSDGIATALQDSASSLMAAGNDLNQSVALVAAANKVVQDPNSVGK